MANQKDTLWYNPATWNLKFLNNSNSNGTSTQSRSNNRSMANNNSGRSSQNRNVNSGGLRRGDYNDSSSSSYYKNVDPYANSGGRNGQYQAQSQTYVQNQKQQIVQRQTFVEQVDNTVLTISLAGKSYHDGQEEDTVNLLCDSAIVSLNMFAVSCEQLHKEKDEDALDLGRKRVDDKFVQLELKNKAVYDTIKPHREFIIAALNGEKNLRYKEDRVEPGVKELFERDPKEINKAYGHMIHEQQKFDEAREAMLEEKTNEKLAKEQELALKEYRRINKQSKNKSGSGSSSKYNRANVKDLYFTKSGKSGKFIDSEAVEREKREKLAMDEDVFGSDDVYNEISSKLRFMNAALKLPEGNKLTGRAEPIPCKILGVNKKERANQDKSMVEIRPCYPWNNRTLFVGLGALELDENKIKKIEKKQIAMLKNYEQDTFKQNLGYKTIEDQEKELDEQVMRDL